MMSTLLARLLAVTGRHAEALADVGRADAHLADHHPDVDPPWLCYDDEAGHEGSTAATLLVFPTSAPQDEATTEFVGALRDDVLPQVSADTGARCSCSAAAWWLPAPLARLLPKVELERT